MTLQRPTKALLSFLRLHPSLRDQIRAARDKTLLYAGSFFKPLWEELEDLKRKYPEVARKETLGDVLSRIPAPGTGHSSLLAYVQDVEAQIPWSPDGFILWRALSGIYASNAIGKVSFQVGSGITPVGKVFAATEVAILSRNPNVDETSKDLLAYFQRCIERGEESINIGFISA